MTTSPNPVRALRTRLGRLRRRVRALVAVRGLGRWVAAAVGLLAAFFLADRLLDLPLGVRRFVRLGLVDRPEALHVLPWLLLLVAALSIAWILTRRGNGWAPVFAFVAAGVVGVLAWFAFRALSPLRVALPDEDLALSVESRFRRLNDRLAAALDFEHELTSPTRGESAEMMGAVVEQAAAEARGLAFQQAASARSTLAWAGAALAAVLAAVGVTLAAPDTIGLWARRSLLLEDREWPRATTIVAVDVDASGQVVERDPARPYEVAVGRPLIVYAAARGEVPDEVALLDLVAGSRPLPRRMFPVPERPGVFQVEVRDVRRPFDFVLVGGDDDDEVPRYHVDITVPPRVLSLEAALTYPAYLERAPETVPGGILTVPQGTQVEVTFETDAEVAEARAVLQERVIAAEPRGGEGKRFAFAFTAEESLRYRILLKTPEGRENDPARDTYDVRVEPDRPPRVAWLYPRGPVETTPEGRVPLLLEAEDDHAVKSLVLEVRRGDDEPVRQTLGVRTGPDAAPGPDDAADATRPALDGRLGRKLVRIYTGLDLADLKDAAGRAPEAAARLTVRVVATDSRGQAKEGPWTSVDVYRPLEKQRTLDARRPGVRGEIVSAEAEQRARQKQVAELVGANLTDADKDLLKTIQFAQGKLAQDVDQAVRALLDIFNGFVYDRLGAQVPNEKILAILDLHHRTTYGQMGQAPEGLGAPPVGDPVFPYALYTQIVEAWRTRVLFDTGLLDRMLAVVAEAVDAATVHAPAAYAAVLAAASGEGPLERAVEAQDALAASLARVLDHMRGWETLSDLILKLRRIAEEQEALTKRLKPDEGSD